VLSCEIQLFGVLYSVNVYNCIIAIVLYCTSQDCQNCFCAALSSRSVHIIGTHMIWGVPATDLGTISDFIGVEWAVIFFFLSHTDDLGLVILGRTQVSLVSIHLWLMLPPPFCSCTWALLSILHAEWAKKTDPSDCAVYTVSARVYPYKQHSILVVISSYTRWNQALMMILKFYTTILQHSRRILEAY